MSGVMDPTGFYCIVRLREQRRGEKLNIGVVVFWKWGWHIAHSREAAGRALDAFRGVVTDEDLTQFFYDLPDVLGFKAPGEFDPNFAYVSLHQYRQQHWELGPVEFSTLRPLRIGYDGQYGYAGGAEEAAHDLLERLVTWPEEAEVYAE